MIGLKRKFNVIWEMWIGTFELNFCSLEESLCLWPELLVEHEFLVNMSLLMLGIHLTTFVHKQNRLDLAWVEADPATQGIGVPTITLE